LDAAITRPIESSASAIDGIKELEATKTTERRPRADHYERNAMQS
jgi:hypothetical protein